MLRRERVPASAPGSRALLTVVLGAFLFFQPAIRRSLAPIDRETHHGEYDSHGDLLPDLLDYLERITSRNAQQHAAAARGRSDEPNATPDCKRRRFLDLIVYRSPPIGTGQKTAALSTHSGPAADVSGPAPGPAVRGHRGLD